MSRTVLILALFVTQLVTLPTMAEALPPEVFTLSPWKAEGKATRTEEAGREVFTVEAGGIWRSEPLTFREGGAYEMRCRLRVLPASASSRTQAFVGPELAPQGSESLSQASVGGEWREFAVRFAIPKGARTQQRVMLSAYGSPDPVQFADVAVVPLMVTHAQREGLTLGVGERVLDAGYEYEAPFRIGDGETPWRNISRVLVEQSAKLHDRRWSFTRAGLSVVHRHEVAGCQFKEATITLDLLCAWETAMKLIVEASKDGREYRECAVLKDSGDRKYSVGQEIAVPKELLPARELWVRVRSEAGKGSAPAIQVPRYHLRAALDHSTADLMVGSTSATSVEGHDEQLMATPLSNGEGAHSFRVKLQNKGTNVATVKPQVRLTTKGFEAETFTAPEMALAAGETREVLVPCTLQRSGTHALVFSLGEPWKTSFGRRFTSTQLDSNHYGETLPGSDDQVGLWWATSGWKIGQHRNLPTRQGKAVSMNMACREVEAAQVVLSPAQPLKQLRIETEALRADDGSVLPASAIEVLRVGYVDVRLASDELGAIGSWPDPLPPIHGPLDLPAGSNQPLWVRITAPADAQPGLYRGRLMLKATGWQREVPMEVRVRGFALPEATSFRTLFGIEPGRLTAYHRATTNEQKAQLAESYLRSFGRHRISPYDPAMFTPLTFKWPGQLVDVWGKDVKLITDAAQCHSGQRCLLTEDTDTKANPQARTEAIAIAEGSALNLSLWYRTESSTEGATAFAVFQDAKGSHLAGMNRFIALPASTEWRRFQYLLKDLPAKAAAVSLRFQGCAYSQKGERTGKLWLDDVSIKTTSNDRELFGGGDMESLGTFQPAQFNWDEWDAAMQRAFDLHPFNTFVLRIPGLGSGDYHSRREGGLLGHAVGTPEHEAIFADWCGQVSAHLKAKGWWDKAVAYPYDEPHEEDVPFVKTQLEFIKKHLPGLRCMIPGNSPMMKPLAGLQDFWCCNTGVHSQAFADERIAAGDTYTLYTCCGPVAPFAANFIDRPATDMRVLMWQAWQTKATGFLMWQTNYWTSAAAYPDGLQNPYLDSMSWIAPRAGGVKKGQRVPFKAGDGRYFYPPEACFTPNDKAFVAAPPVDTLRLEMTRDGIEDYDYLVLLRDLLAEAKLAPTEAKDFEALLAVPPAISESLRRYTIDPTPIETHRESVAQAIERLMKLERQ